MTTETSTVCCEVTQGETTQSCDAYQIESLEADDIRTTFESVTEGISKFVNYYIGTSLVEDPARPTFINEEDITDEHRLVAIGVLMYMKMIKDKMEEEIAANATPDDTEGGL